MTLSRLCCNSLKRSGLTKNAGFGSPQGRRPGRLLSATRQRRRQPQQMTQARLQPGGAASRAMRLASPEHGRGLCPVRNSAPPSGLALISPQITTLSRRAELPTRPSALTIFHLWMGGSPSGFESRGLVFARPQTCKAGGRVSLSARRVSVVSASTDNPSPASAGRRGLADDAPASTARTSSRPVRNSTPSGLTSTSRLFTTLTRRAELPIRRSAWAPVNPGGLHRRTIPLHAARCHASSRSPRTRPRNCASDDAPPALRYISAQPASATNSP